MSCSIANGRLEPCKDAVGGIDAIYFINYGDITGVTNDVTYPDDIDLISGVSSVYKFELKGTNTFDQVITSSRENGTTFVEQTLTFTLKKQDSTTHKNVKLLSYGRPHVIIKNRNNQYFLAGYEHGMELTTANVMNGSAMGDLNGYTLTMVGTERLAANILQVGTPYNDAALATLLDDATIVTA